MHALHISLKDLRLLLRDRRTLILLLALPLTFITIIGLSTGQLLNQRETNEEIKIAIVNLDKGKLSESVVESLSQKGGLLPKILSSREEAEQQLKHGKIVTRIVIGPGFQEKVDELDVTDLFDTDEGKLQGLESLDIELKSRPSLAATGAIVDQLVLAAVVHTIAPRVAEKSKFIKQRLDRERERRAEEQGTAGGGKVDKTRANGGAKSKVNPGYKTPDQNVYQVLVPSYTVMFSFFLVILMARSFISERELGTLARLRMSPVSRTGLLLGKTVPFYIISLAQSLLLFLTGKVLFHMYWGPSIPALLCVIACTSLAATGLGLLVAMLARTDTQVSAYANFLVITMAGISGCFMPREWQPALVQQIGLATPHAWALIAYEQLLVHEEPQYSIVARSCAVLVTFATAFYAIGWWRFRSTDQNA